jgi:hypothetical protein
MKKSWGDRERPANSFRLPYEAPRLVQYGSMKMLTTGGTQNKAESVNKGTGKADAGRI